MRIQQLKKQIRIEVHNAQYALEQSSARVVAAREARDLAQKTFDISKQEQKLGSGSNLQTLTAQRDLALAESTLAASETTFEKSRVELARAIGQTLDEYHVSIEDAKSGVVQSAAIDSGNVPADRAIRPFRNSSQQSAKCSNRARQRDVYEASGHTCGDGSTTQGAAGASAHCR